MQITLSALKPLTSRYIVFLLFLFIYTGIMQQCGGLPSMHTAWRLEIPLLLYLYYYCNLITRASRLQALVTAVPIFLAYGIFDVYHLLLGRLLRITEVNALPEMFQVLPPAVSVLVILLLVLPLLTFLNCMQWNRLRPLMVGALPLLALPLAVELAPDLFIAAFEKTQKPIDPCSDRVSAGTIGRLSMTLYNEAKRKSSLEKTTDYRGRSFFTEAFAKEVDKVNAIRTKGNVHLIVLESFFDPNLLRNARFSRNPAHPDFEALFKKNEGISVSPVFGGGTAQSEFELLCGVPAMRELSGIEFDVFTGSKTYCLPNVLTQGGYHTMATNAFLPDFFNSTNAYAGMGFDKIYYPSEFAEGRESYFTIGDVTGETYMFDGDLLTQNLAFIEKQIRENPARPLFNYIISMYGHTPHDINTEKRPLVVTMLGEDRDEQIEKAVNQYYYRTEAIARYVKEMVRIDPKSIIILVSDHLPSLTFGPNTYRDLNYLDQSEDFIHLNRIYVMENGRAVRYTNIHHYDVPKIILDYVTRDRSGKSHTARKAVSPPNGPVDMRTYREQYMAIMANAMDAQPMFPDFNFLSIIDFIDEPAATPATGTGPGKNSL
ncbi:MAG: LTA synthase family protein [Deltaproteobacteria bacterium]|nr:LTA synthase family protein [Deltaproteobacteria bacterium]